MSNSTTDAVNCGSGGGADDFANVRIASVFVILIGSLAGGLFPVIANRSSWMHIPKPVFDFAKYFGSGVIIATAFIHLLAPGIDELSSPCLSPEWLIYPYPLALALLAVFSIFIVEVIAFRWGTAKLAKLGKVHNAHGHPGIGSEASPELKEPSVEKVSDIEDGNGDGNDSFVLDDNVLAQIVGIAILEFGILLHSLLIGLTLAVTSGFITLFVVIIFHQLFEGLGVGSRLAYLEMPRKYRWVPFAGAVLYGFMTPLGIAVGLGVKTTYNPDSTTATLVSGVLDSLSAGILLYTGLVELLAHEFLFNDEMKKASNGKVAYALCTMLTGCGIMALLGRWA